MGLWRKRDGHFAWHSGLYSTYVSSWRGVQSDQHMLRKWSIYKLPSTPIYTSSKASVSSITEVLKLQLEQAEANVKVSILFPGPHTVRTKLFSAERNRPQELARDPNAPEHPISSVEDMVEMMNSMGIEIETTEPEEVASFCIDQIKNQKYWINPLNDKSEQAFKDRVESIITRSDLPNPNIF